jgi:hypothetical protein
MLLRMVDREAEGWIVLRSMWICVFQMDLRLLELCRRAQKEPGRMQGVKIDLGKLFKTS